MPPRNEHPVAVALAPLALGGAGRLPLMRSEGLRGSFISTGAEIHALKQDRGERQLPPVNTCELLSEPVVVHGSHHGADDAREVGEVVQRNGWHG
jgi:hypothetical protein